MSINNYLKKITNIYNPLDFQSLMPINIQRLIRDKDMIISTLQSRGPCLPVQIARSINQSLLFASAFLSELYSEKRIKMSNMRVGSSPLYYIQGQETQLENFIGHLAPKEKEAFYILKKSKILEDEKQEPAIRVALREIKDFAHPIKKEINFQPKIFWKYSLLGDEEAFNIIQDLINPKPLSPGAHKKKTEKLSSSEQQIIPQETITPKITQIQQSLDSLQEEIKAQATLTLPPITQLPSTDTKITDMKLAKEKPKRARKKSVKSEPKESKFAKNIKDYLAGKDIELLQVIEEAKKDFIAKVRIDTLFGKQEYYLLAKDKKKISESDIIHALHKAQLEKMPALILAPGEIDKKSLDFHKDFRNLIKFEKVKF